MSNFRAVVIATILNNAMPWIGFFNGAKRINAYVTTCKHAEKLAKGDTALAMETITVLNFMSSAFHKSAVMVMTNIDTLDANRLGNVGWLMANTQLKKIFTAKDAEVRKGFLKLRI